MADCKNNADYTADSEKYMSNCNHSSEDWVFSVGGSTVTKKVVTDDIYFEGITDVTINQGADFDPTEGVSAHDGNGNELPFEVVPSELTDPCEIGEHDFEYKAYKETHPLLPTWCNSDKRAIYVPPCNMVAKIVHRIVTVVQSALPTFSGLVKAVLNVGQSFDPMSGVSATDANGNPIEDITYSGTYDDEAKGKIASFETEFAQNAKVVETSFEPIQGGTPWMSDTLETEPYNYRRTADGEIEHSFNSEYDEIVGASVGWNQLVGDAVLFAYTSSAGVTITKNNDGTVTINGTASNVFRITDNLQTMKDHVCFVTDVNKNVRFYDGTPAHGITDKNNGGLIKGNSRWELYCYENGTTFNNTIVKPMVVDLTLMNSQIADYVYSLEQSTAGSGVTWLRNHFPKLFTEYQPYDAGSIKSVSGLTAHEMVGVNVWDEEWENGSIGTSDGQNTSGSNLIRSKNYISVIPNETYWVKAPASSGGNLFYYDADKNYLSYVGFAVNTYYTIPSNARYVRFRMGSSYGTTYKNDICFNISDASIDGQYFPHESHTYSLDSSVELRGKYYLDSNNQLRADGDVWKSVGSINRAWNEVVLNGSEAWNKSTIGLNNFYTPISGMKSYASVITSIYPQTTDLNKFKANYGYVYVDNNFCIEIDPTICGGTTANDFKTWLTQHPITVAYEIATPTAESATAYENPQWCDSHGTEEYVGSELPVGHNTRYADIYPISGWTDVEVTKTGKNLLDNDGITDETNWESLGSSRYAWALNLPKNTQITVSGEHTLPSGQNAYVYLQRYNGTEWEQFYVLWQARASNMPYTFTTDDAEYRLWSYNEVASIRTIDWMQIELGSTATDYEPHQGNTYPISWQTEAGTVYGGTIDLVSGTLTVDMALADLGTLNWTYYSSETPKYFEAYVPNPLKASGVNFICDIYPTKPTTGTYEQEDKSISGSATSSRVFVVDSAYTDVATFKTAMSGRQLCYELATPQTYQLTRHQIGLLLGQNNVWSDTNGETRVVFMKNLPQSGSVTYPLAGTYEITYEAEDQCGNVGTATREVEVTAS